MSQVRIGDRVRDRVGGFEGIVTGMSQWITGCDRASVQAPSKDGKLGESYWIDVHTLDVLEAGAVVVEPPKGPPRGGPPSAVGRM